MLRWLGNKESEMMWTDAVVPQVEELSRIWLEELGEWREPSVSLVGVQAEFPTRLLQNISQKRYRNLAPWINIKICSFYSILQRISLYQILHMLLNILTETTPLLERRFWFWRFPRLSSAPSARFWNRTFKQAMAVSFLAITVYYPHCFPIRGS